MDVVAESNVKSSNPNFFGSKPGCSILDVVSCVIHDAEVAMRR